jgi:NAD(P)H-hydrate epimerase
MMAFDAACAGVYLHGLAGDRSALRLGQTALAATDVVEELPRAFRDVIPR